MRGPVRDQAALIGIINRLQGQGIELRGIRQIGPGQALPPAHDPAEP
jgi:hypothetical protein